MISKGQIFFHYSKALLFLLIFQLGSIGHASWLSLADSNAGVIDQELEDREKKAKESGDDVILRLVQYRNSVEKDAYKTTMQLCIGYQMARGVDVPMYHKQQPYSKEGAVSAWVDIFNHGLRQPFSAIGGIKADYIEVQNVPILSIDYWLQSLYVMYLVRSDGFLKASVHCLNTIDHDEMFHFALAIARVDAQATALTELGLLLTGEAVISIIAKSSRWVFRPVAQLTKVIVSRMNRTYWKIAGVIVIPIALDSFIVHMKKISEQQKALDGLLASLASQTEESGRSQRLIITKGAFDILTKTLQQYKTEEEAIMALEFKNYIQSHYEPKKLTEYNHDYHNLKRQSQLTEMDQLYLSLLELMLPIITENSR